MDIRHLRYFVCIAECGSMMKASQRLRVAQPALSVHVANLEGELGVKLLERGNRGVMLTNEGRNLYERARTLLSDYQDMIASLRDLRGHPSGTVSLGLPSSTAPFIAADLYRMVREELPDVTLYIADSSTAILYEWLQEGRLDFAMLFSLPDSSDLLLTPLAIEEFCLVSKPGTTSGADTIDFEDLFREPLITTCQSTTWRKVLDEIAERHGKSFRSTMETEAMAVIKSVVASGQARGILPLSSVRRETQDGEFAVQRIIKPEIRGVLSLAQSPSLEMTPARRAICDMVVRVMRDYGAAGASPQRSTATTPILRAVPDKVLPTAGHGAR